MGNNQLLEQYRLRVISELEELTSILHWFETISELYLPKPICWQCQIALTEGFTNTVRHAHKHLPKTTPIDLEVIFFSHSIEMKIWDWGQPFDLEAFIKSISKEDIQSQEKEQGRGLYLIQQLTDSVAYIRYQNGQNCLTMSKKLQPRD